MQLKKILIGVLLSTTSLSVLALIGAKQAEINNGKAFVVITIVALILGAMAFYQKQLQPR
ncbi:hypothetical protein [Bathymodiolus septemdierum thioautotrophic gill symbiont]|uniref:Uncharacterized protein n=1 Tax=endosymbiont of Bathymodiolus septemdierum str. Myojin knoll TaxID=1303921 RepID=A0A0P0URM4_9GAMM|nr:hypothetical protein [Bathymodiolus septemdierum thioautotrophic gill symbiont]BAS67441.1 hypothetical protein BSEPE_0428 [endosymbiont of Bathymodiolus septemdierum str. Myojin knoll]